MAKPTSTVVLTAHRLHGALRWASNTVYGNLSSVRKLVKAQETGCLAQKLVMCKALAWSLYLNSLWTNTYSGSWSTWRGTAKIWATCSHTPAWEGSDTITLCWLGKDISEIQFKLRQRESALKHLKTSWGYKGWVEKGTVCDKRKKNGADRQVALLPHLLILQQLLVGTALPPVLLQSLQPPDFIHSSSSYVHFNCLQQISGGKWSLINSGWRWLDNSERRGPS